MSADIQPAPDFTARAGRLYVVATPIGNLSDITLRAKQILASCDLVLCEDTRSTGKLLHYLGLKRPMESYHDHNERQKAPALADKLQEGSSICLVSDAGTPAISDPGFRLVRECRRRNIPVEPIPGPCAFIAALSASGLPTNGFLFVGFLPPKSAARKKFFEEHRDFPYTLVLYESCHRIAKAVAEATEVLGPDRVLAVAKELTKLHETFLVGPTVKVKKELVATPLKGEFVFLIAPRDFEL